jgi:thiosulfate dehydrogenase [quinone] large subunit
MRQFTQHLHTLQPQTVTQIPVSPVAKFLFLDTHMAWLWLLVRLYVGYTWFAAGWGKLTGHSIALGSFGRPLRGGAWVFSAQSGMALKGFVMGALARASGPDPIVQDWYASFLQHVVLPNAAIFAYLITGGELAVGFGLLLGVITGIAALFGTFMNFNYLCAGSVSINPVLIVLSLFLLLAWRIAGYYGLDRYLIPLLGTPWTGSLIHKQEAVPAVT